MTFVTKLGVVLAVLGFDAAVAQEGYLGHDHDKWHHGFYKTLETPRHQKPVLQSYRLSSHLRETGRWPLRGEGEWRVGIRTCRQNPETVGPRPWISRLCSFQIRWAT
jgi:hypothetical protein